MDQVTALKVSGEADFSKAEQAFQSYANAVQKATASITADMSTLGKVVQMPNVDTSSLKGLEIANANLRKSIAEAEKAELQAAASRERANTTIVRQGEEYKKLSLSYRQAAAEAQNYAAKMVLAGKSLDEINADEGFKKLQLEAKTLNQQLTVIDASVGKYGRNVGNYASHWNGLGNAINQLTREAPAFANSLNTGFMAISNNLPTLSDEIKKLRAQNKALQAEGKPTVSILGQLAGAVFSWQTALSLGVTLLTIYGEDITKFAESVISGAKGIDKAKVSANLLNEAFKDTSIKNAIQDLQQLKTNVDLARQGFIDQHRVVNEYNETMGKTTGKVKTLAEVESKLVSDGADYIKMIELKAKAQAAFGLAASKAVEAQLIAMKPPKDAQNALDKFNATFLTMLASPLFKGVKKTTVLDAFSTTYGTQRQAQQTKQLTDEEKFLNKLGENSDKEAAEIAKRHKNWDYFGGEYDDKKEKKGLTDAQRQAKQIKEVYSKFYADLDTLTREHNSNLIDDKEYNSGLESLASNTLKRLAELKVNINPSDKIIAQIIGTQSDAVDALRKINFLAALPDFQRQLKELADKSNLDKLDLVNSLNKINIDDKKISGLANLNQAFKDGALNGNSYALALQKYKNALENVAISSAISEMEKQNETLKTSSDQFDNNTRKINEYEAALNSSNYYSKETVSQIKDKIDTLKEENKNLEQNTKQYLDNLKAIQQYKKELNEKTSNDIQKQIEAQNKALEAQMSAYERLVSAFIDPVFDSLSNGKNVFKELTSSVKNFALELVKSYAKAKLMGAIFGKFVNKDDPKAGARQIEEKYFPYGGLFSPIGNYNTQEVKDTKSQNKQPETIKTDPTTGFIVSNTQAVEANTQASESNTSGLGNLANGLGGFASALGSLGTGGQIAGGLFSMLPAFVPFASGGIVSGPTHALIGEYAGASSNPEVVAPLSDLQKYIGGSKMDVRVHGEIGNDVIRLSNSRSTNKRNR